MAACSFLGISFWSRLADKTGRQKLIYFVLIFLSSCFFLPLYFKPNTMLLTLLLAAYSFCINGMNPILSYIVLRMLERSGLHENKTIYGRQVLFGSFASIAANLALGPSIDRYGEASVFYVFFVAAVLLFSVVVFCFPGDSKDTKLRVEKSDAVETLPQPSTSENIFRLFHGNSRFAIFLGVIFLTGCARSVMSAFVTLYYQKLNLSKTQSMCNLASGVMLEMACFYWGPKMADLSPHWMLVIAQVAMVVRSWAYLCIPQNEHAFCYLLAVELLKGLAFGMTHLAGVQVARESAPEGLETTAQGLYEGIYSQLPSVFATPLGGWALHRFGFVSLFLVTACGISVSCFFVTITFWHSGKLKHVFMKD